MPFQTVVNQQPGIAVEGDFASANPYATAIPAPGTYAFVAGSTGAIVGLFGWADANGNVTNAGSGVPTGFIGRKQGDALIVAWLGASSMTIQQGMMVTLFTRGDFYVRSAGAATKGQKAFASNTTGAVTFAAAGGTVAGSTETAWYAAASANAGELTPITQWN